ncbi:ankyrin repeat domain-containing protein, partial [Mycena vulgaris]
FLDWFSPINFFLRHADISQVRQKGTGGWLLGHPLFKKWQSGSGSTLWCRGIPGAGKTVLASMVADHLSAACRNNRDTGIACIYLNHKEVDNQTPSKLLAGLWRQLALDKDISSVIENLYKQHREKGTVPSLEEVVNVLRSSLKEFSKVFVIVDALDEYPNESPGFQRETLLQYLAEMGSNVNLMITSRPNISPESSSLPNLETLDIQAAPEDIQAYINAQIKLSPRLSKHVQRQPKLGEDIHSKISSKSVDGMFLLAKLHIDSLSTKNTIREVREAMNALPESLYDSYEIAIQRIDAQSNADRKTAHSAITWVANAKRPLTVEELQVALAVKPGMRKLDEEEDLTDIDIILSVCAGLVIVDRESSVVRLVHYTTQEYLDSIQTLLFPDAQTEITCTLLTFLAFDGYPDASWELGNPPPLVEYSQYCLAHAAGQPEIQLREILISFLGRALQWIKVMSGGMGSSSRWNSPPWNYSNKPSEPSVLWIAAAANLVETTSVLLEKGADVNAAGGEYGSSLHAAAAGGHTEIVGILLEKGADVNAAGGEYWSSLELAAAVGHTEIVRILVEKGADINAAGGFYGSPLQAAVAQGHTEIVGMLLEKGADNNAARGEYGSSLELAAAAGHTEIVRILLEKGAEVNAAGGRDGTSLEIAATRGHTEIVGILLEKGADVNAAGGRDGSSLQAAAAVGHAEIVRILLEKGADVNAAGGFYGSSLQAAAAGGHTEIVSILLEKGADVNAAGGKHGSSLQAAAAHGHTEILGILLEMGADVNAAGGESGGSLQAAAARGHTELGGMLLERCARFPVPVENERDAQ